VREGPTHNFTCELIDTLLSTIVAKAVPLSDTEEANIGLATGSVSGIWILDVDGDQGRETLATLEEQHGQLPATVEVILQRGLINPEGDQSAFGDVRSGPPARTHAAQKTLNANRGDRGLTDGRRGCRGVLGMPSVRIHVDGGFAVGASSFNRQGSPHSLSCATA
jgi:hypothetical protein